MKNLVILSKDINQVDSIMGCKGTYRAIVKVQAGFMTIVEDLGVKNKWGKNQWNSAMDVFRGFKRGALQSIQFRAEGYEYWSTVFAKVGTKVKLMDVQMFEDMTVGDINQDWSNTNLCDYKQYKAVNAKTWADKAFVDNQLVTNEVSI